ncbi:MAG: DUF5018 domain-containing protein [Bacteroidales bacterium]|nr:DUF5018 domain-containing protein [Bacteroidales bacterium]
MIKFHEMKKLFYILIVCMFAVVSCHEPQYIEPTALRDGITSITAYFTNTSKTIKAGTVLAVLNVEDPDADEFVIPVPYYYPEESTDPTNIHMGKVRLRAELAPNCRIDPPLTVVNLSEDNVYQFTNAEGKTREIIIKGKRVKSNKSNLMTFTLTQPYEIEGFINEDTKEVYLFTTDDLDGFSAKVTVAPHAETDTTALKVAKNYNLEQEVKVTAHDGSSSTYKILKKYPTKIPYGFRSASFRQLFNLDPVQRLGLTEYTDSTVCMTLAYAAGKLIISQGNGNAPIYCNPLTGLKEGEINAGSVDIAAITSDEAGNLICSNYAEPDGTIVLYKTKSVTEAPVQFHSFVNESDVPVGHVLKVNGSIDDDAVIILTHEPVAGVTLTSKFVKIVITDGAVVSTETIDLAGLDIAWSSWGMAPINTPKVVPVSNMPDSGVMLSWYSTNIIYYIDGNGKLVASRNLLDKDKVDSNDHTVTMEAKTYNNAPYVIHMVSSHFPMWGRGPVFRIWDASDPASISSSAALKQDKSPVWFQTGAQGWASSDLVIGSSADGFKMYIYLYDHNASVVTGFVADCIDI